MICTKCQREIEDSAKHCKYCGANQETTTVCKVCGAELSKKHVFCAYCGAKVEELPHEKPEERKEYAASTGDREAVPKNILQPESRNPAQFGYGEPLYNAAPNGYQPPKQQNIGQFGYAAPVYNAVPNGYQPPKQENMAQPAFVPPAYCAPPVNKQKTQASSDFREKELGNHLVFNTVMFAAMFLLLIFSFFGLSSVASYDSTFYYYSESQNLVDYFCGVGPLFTGKPYIANSSFQMLCAHLSNYDGLGAFILGVKMLFSVAVFVVTAVYMVQAIVRFAKKEAYKKPFRPIAVLLILRMVDCALLGAVQGEYLSASYGTVLSILGLLAMLGFVYAYMSFMGGKKEHGVCYARDITLSVGLLFTTLFALGGVVEYANSGSYGYSSISGLGLVNVLGHFSIYPNQMISEAMKVSAMIDFFIHVAIIINLGLLVKTTLCDIFEGVKSPRLTIGLHSLFVALMLLNVIFSTVVASVGSGSLIKLSLSGETVMGLIGSVGLLIAAVLLRGGSFRWASTSNRLNENTGYKI